VQHGGTAAYARRLGTAYQEGRSVKALTEHLSSWLIVIGIVGFWGWVLRRGLKTRTTLNGRVLVGCALFVFLFLLWSFYVALKSSH
jgi:hypothetical protein